MTTAPTVGWLGRTFGWAGTRAEWLGLAGGLVWLAGLCAIAHYARTWSIGASLAATLGWFLVLAIVARTAVRDLFGPVFFYDLLRVSRSTLTHILRGFYALCIGCFLAIMYYAWMLDHTTYRNHTLTGQFSLFGAIITLGLTVGIFLGTRTSWLYAIRLLLLVGGIGFTIFLVITSASLFLRSVTDPSQPVDVLPPSALSRFATVFFEAYAITQFCVMALLTPVSVAATIAVEKERKTLEFLLATDLRNREIVFGKLAARVLSLVMYVLAGLPLMAFLQLFGGIDPEQLLAVTIATIMMILGLSALSIWVSTTLRRARDAIMITYLLVLAYGFCTFMLAGLTTFGGPGWWNAPIDFGAFTLGINDICCFFADGNPAWAICKYLNGGRAAGLGLGGTIPEILRDFVVFWAIAIVVLLGSSILKLRHVALVQAYGGIAKRTAVHPKALGKRKRIRDVESETANPVLLVIDGTNRRPPMGANPLTWKEVFVDSTFKSGWLGRLLALGILGLTFIWPLIFAYNVFIDPSRMRYQSGNLSENWYEFNEMVSAWCRTVTGVLGFLMMMAAAMRGASSISGEKDKDTWISLASTPLSSEDVLAGKFWGCIFSLRRAFLVLLLVWGFALATGSMHPLTIPLMFVLTAVYVTAFALAGIFCSIGARTTLIASVRAFFAAIFCAGGFWAVLGILCFLPLSLMRTGYRFNEQVGSFFMGFTPPLVYGNFALPGLTNRDLGIFRDSDYKVGLLGPFFGTIFWILFSFVMTMLCRNRLAVAMNRAPMRQQFPRESRRPVARRSTRESDRESPLP